MIDLTSKDYTYLNLKAIEIERMLKEIVPDMSELKSSEIVGMALIIFAYLLEGKFFDKDADEDLRLVLYDDVLFIDVKDITMQLHFKNALVNQILEQKPISEFSIGETIKELAGDGL